MAQHQLPEASRMLRRTINNRDAPELYAKLMGAGSPSAYVRQWKWRVPQHRTEAKMIARAIELEVDQFGETAVETHQGSSSC